MLLLQGTELVEKQIAVPPSAHLHSMAVVEGQPQQLALLYENCGILKSLDLSGDLSEAPERMFDLQTPLRRGLVAAPMCQEELQVLVVIENDLALVSKDDH